MKIWKNKPKIFYPQILYVNLDSEGNIRRVFQKENDAQICEERHGWKYKAIEYFGDVIEINNTKSRLQ